MRGFLAPGPAVSRTAAPSTLRLFISTVQNHHRARSRAFLAPAFPLGPARKFPAGAEVGPFRGGGTKPARRALGDRSSEAPTDAAATRFRNAAPHWCFYGTQGPKC